MPQGYKHLTYEDRCQIYALKQRNISVKKIADDIGHHRSSVYRELNRNTGQRGYRFKQAHGLSVSRRASASHSSNRKMTPDLIESIELALTKSQWSPVQIAGRFRTLGAATISHESIYRHILQDKKDGGILYTHLRRSGKKYNKRGSKNAGRGLIPGRIDIDERPSIVEEKTRLGDWELDTIIGKDHVGAIVSMVDRKSKYTKLSLVNRRTGAKVSEAITQELDGLQSKVLTLTADNGKEFAKHQQIADSLDAKVYFAKPYQSWQRGLNEHTNGLVRQYFPKKTRFDTLTEKDVRQVEEKLNSRPRKILNFKTPVEVFYELKELDKSVALRC